MNAISSAANHRLDKAMLHKNSDEDVLISYGRGGLPLRISANLLADLENSDFSFLRPFYRLATLPPPLHQGEDRDACYLRTIPVFIEEKEAADSEAACRMAIHAHYCDVQEGKLLCSQYINEVDEAVLAHAFGRGANWIQDRDRVRISKLAKTLGRMQIPDIFYATFYNDLQNYFFYRKHHEHVPGTMLIEAARQGFYAQFYGATGVRPGEVSISMDSLYAEFDEYTNPNYPVRIMVEDVNPGLPENNQRQIYKRATFQQLRKVVGRVEMRGHVMKMKYFKRMRNLRFPDTHRFSPVKNISRSMLLDDGRGHKHECALDELSMKGFTVTFDKDRNIPYGQVFNYLFFADGLGFIDGKVECLRAHGDDGGAVANLAILEITDEAEGKLREVIKNYTHVITTQGVF